MTIRAFNHWAPLPRTRVSALARGLTSALILAGAFLLGRAVGSAHAADAGTVKAYDLPAYLKDKWKMNEPSMNENSRCAVTWDGSGDIDRMVMSCSIHIRMAAEGERRALKGCEDERREKGIARPCRLVLR